MAVWQFTLFLLPASDARMGEAGLIRLSPEQVDGIVLTMPTDEVFETFDRLGPLLPEAKSWDAKLRMWGDAKTDDIQIWFDDDRVESVQFRLNAHGTSPALVEGICAIARDLGCVLASQEGAIIQPTSEALSRMLSQSPATKFVRDPQGYLKGVETIPD